MKRVQPNPTTNPQMQRFKEDEKAENCTNLTSEKDKMARTIIKKLIKTNRATITDLPQLLDMLDKNYEVNIDLYTDEYVKHKLYKLFKLFGLVHDAKNKSLFKKLKNSACLIDPENSQKITMKDYAEKIINIFEKPEQNVVKTAIELKKACIRPEEKEVLPDADIILATQKNETQNNEDDAWIQIVENSGPIKLAEKEENFEKEDEIMESQPKTAKTLFEEHSSRMRRLKKIEEKAKRSNRMVYSLSQGDALL